jgi:hypothetical protein
MTREAPDIEESLQLCKDMDSPSIVIPVSGIAKYFPAPSPPGYPEVPCYDLGELKAWAEEKGWAVTFATTGTITDKRMLPGIRFTPLLEKDSEPNATPSPPAQISSNENNWQNKTLYYVAIGVVIAVLAAFAIHLIKKHFGIPL